MTEIQQGIHPKQVMIKLNGAFSPQLPHGESLRYATPTGLPPVTDEDYKQSSGYIQGRPTSKSDTNKTYFRAKAFINPERGVADQLMHQLPSSPLITVAPEKFASALKIHVDKGDRVLQKETIGLSILPDGDGKHKLAIDQQDPFLGAAFGDFFPAFRKTNYFQKLENLQNRFENISFYNALNVLLKQNPNIERTYLNFSSTDVLSNEKYPTLVTGEVNSGLVVELKDSFRDQSSTQNLETILGASSKLYPMGDDNQDTRAIDFGMLFAVKSVSKGWELYHCKPADFKALADKLNDSYQGEKVSINLITHISAVRNRNSSDKVQYSLNLDSQSYSKKYSNFKNFISAVETNPGKNTTRVFFNENASPLHPETVRLEPAAKS